MLNPRAIAVQGIGYSPRLVSVQGLWPVSVESGFSGGFAWNLPSRRTLRRWIEEQEASVDRVELAELAKRNEETRKAAQEAAERVHLYKLQLRESLSRREAERLSALQVALAMELHTLRELIARQREEEKLIAVFMLAAEVMSD
jgi:hypothetical protein